MIVAIDGFEWRDRPTGVGRFMKNLLSTLIPAAPEHRFFLFLCAPLQNPPDWPNLTLVVKDHSGGYFGWQNAVLPGLIARHGCDRLLAPNNISPLRPGVPALVVVHDVSWRGTPRDYSWKQRLSLDLRARWSLRRADGHRRRIRFQRRRGGALVRASTAAASRSFTTASSRACSGFPIRRSPPSGSAAAWPAGRWSAFSAPSSAGDTSSS